MRPAASSPSCVYCGLPLPWTWRSPAAGAGPLYCCYGCRFAAAVTGQSGEQGEATLTLTRLGLAVFFTMNVMAFTMALWSRDLYGGEASPLEGLFRSLCLLFSLPVLWLLGGPLLANAWEGLCRGVLATDLLLVLGVATSYLLSVLSVLRDEGSAYFEVGCFVLVFVTLGRWLEATGKLRSCAALEALHRLLPDTVRLQTDAGEEVVPAERAVIGDIVRVLPGERLPCDGRLLERRATLDEQVVTGESVPVIREPGESVHAGTLSVDGEVRLQVSAPAGAGALSRLIELVRQARQSRGACERQADRLSALFLPLVILLALGATGYHSWHHGPEKGVLAGLSVLLIACPCALGLATPLTLWTALGQAARAQVLFRDSESLERLAGVRVVCLDKTGTLTTGTPVVERLAVADEAERAEVLRRAALLARASTHVHSRALLEFLGAPAGPVGETVRTLPGRGLVAELAVLGSLRLMEEEKLSLTGHLAEVVAAVTAEGLPLTCIGWGGRVRGVAVFREELRADAVPAIAALRQLHLDIHVLTGDHAGRAARLGQELGVPVRAGLLPEDKVEVLGALRRIHGPVAMVGDGINDAPALAHSDVGVALGCGTDVARDSARVCLLGNQLLRLVWSIAWARRTLRAARQNLVWSFGYNSLGIALACSGALNPIVAAVAMVGSSLIVVGNALRLARPWDQEGQGHPATVTGLVADGGGTMA